MSDPIPPPAFARTGASPVAPRFNTQRNPDEIKAERTEDRAAKLSLAAKPEIIAVGITFSLLWIVVVDGELLPVLIGLGVFALFGGIFMAGGDTVIASLQLGAVGILTAAVLGDTLRIESDSLWWLLPGLVLIGCEAAATYNNYRRRDGEISARIPRSGAQNLVAVVLMSLVLATIARELTQLDGRVEWPWFATVVIVFTLALIAALLVIRRSATPADTRRFNPGRRMLPPPRL